MKTVTEILSYTEKEIKKAENIWYKTTNRSNQIHAEGCLIGLAAVKSFITGEIVHFDLRRSDS